jgi:hypothetical protein
MGGEVAGRWVAKFLGDEWLNCWEMGGKKRNKTKNLSVFLYCTYSWNRKMLRTE